MKRALRTPLKFLFVLAALAASPPARAQQLLWESTGPPNSAYGGDVAPIGDVNGDGVPDLLVGAWLAFNEAGGVFVLSGSTGGQISQVMGPAVQYYLGFTVASPGDTTGDGIPEILAGSTGPGARLYSGATGALIYEWFLGYTWVAAIGESSGDGVPDILVGAPQMNGLGGAAFVYSGADGSALLSLYGPISYGIFGAGVAAVGDQDGDGVQEFVVGAPVHAAWSNQPGHAYVYSGATGMLLDTLSTGATSWDDFGRRPAGLGDVTGDGIPDFLVRTTGVGRIYSGADRSLFYLLTAVAPEYSVWTVAPSGDVDGDGVPDVVVGSPGSGPYTIPTQLATGLATVRSGSDWSILATMVPQSTDGLAAGWSVASPGDVDGDDFPEIAVGAPGGAPIPPVSKVRLYSGAPVGIDVVGTGCPGSTVGIPRIAATRSPKVGTTFSINLSRTAPGRPALLLLGLSTTQWWGIPLPLDLGPFGVPGCSLLVSPDFVFGLTTTAFGPGNGRAVFPVTIPNDPTLAGAQFYAQWYVVDPGPTAVPGAMTRALAVTIQS